MEDLISPDSKIWPSRVGPAIPSEDSASARNPPMDMNTALARLRRELAGMQTQDKNLLRQLLTLRASVLSLKADMVIERERAEMEEYAEFTDTKQQQQPTRSRAVVTKVEIIDERPATRATRRSPEQDADKPIQIKHAKQDSGFLTDEEEEEEGFEEEQEQVNALTARVVATRSYSVVAMTTTHRVPERGNSREVSKNASKTKKASAPARPRTYTAPEILIPPKTGDREKKEKSQLIKTEAFRFKEFEGRIRTSSVPEDTAFYRREGHRGSLYGFSNTPKMKPRMVKAASSMDLRSESYYRMNRDAANMQPYKVYRSVSQVSLV